MLTQDSLVNRQIKDKETIAFLYRLNYESDDEGQLTLPVHFTKMIHAEQNEWNVFIRINPTVEKESQIYEFNYVLPKRDMSLITVAATGLRLFQMVLQEEIQNKHLIEFEITDLINANQKLGE